MMDAGMRLFETEKPFGNVLGGIKHEMESYGKVYRRPDSTPSMFPDSTGECDLFLDWSTPLRKRCISCRLEDAGDDQLYGLCTDKKSRSRCRQLRGKRGGRLYG